MKILHLTSWYPNKDKPLEAIWIKRLIQAIASDQEQEVHHLSVNSGKHLRIKNWGNGAVKHSIWELPTKRWIILEIVNFFLLVYYLLFKRIHKNCDIINFHIAYPQLVFWSILKPFVKIPVVVSEHWSAYHFNFGVQRELPRIQRIFKQGIPVITVSQSLADDIKRFSKQPFLKNYLVPNAVDKSNFHKYEGIAVNDFPSFFMLSQWKWPKEPEVIIRAFCEVIKLTECQGHTLRIGGSGILVEKMKALTYSLRLNEKVIFLGSLEPEAIAIEMNRCEAFLHCTQYETFSVVCAEALCCGAPVIASEVGGIPEFINTNNGILVRNNTTDEWILALTNLRERKFDRTSISKSAQEKFSSQKVGYLYLNVLKEISGAKK